MYNKLLKLLQVQLLSNRSEFNVQGESKKPL